MAYIRSRPHAARPSDRLCQAASTALWVAGLSSTLCPPALAQAPADPGAQQLPEVKVKAQAEEATPKAGAVASPKYTQPLLDTPQTIAVLKKETLQQQGASTLAEAMRNTPGIALLLGENGNTSTGDAIQMRGFDTQGNVFVDGVRDLGFVSRDMFNVEQVEVFKGPVGVDNGRGAASGYINLVSKVPVLDDLNNGSLAVHSAGLVRATVDLNRAVDDALPGMAWRLNLMKQAGDVAGRDLVRKDQWAIAPSLALGLGGATKAYVYALHAEQDNRPDGGVPTFGLPGYQRAASVSATVVPTPVDPENYYGSRNDFDRVRQDMLTLRIEHELAPGTALRQTVRLAHTQQRSEVTGVNAVTASSADASTWTVARTRQGRDQQNDILAAQTHLGTGFKLAGLQHTVGAGVELLFERAATRSFSVSGTQPAASLLAPNPDDVFLPLVANGGYGRGNTLTAALYAADTLQFNEQWQATLGWRHDRFRTEYFSATYTAASGSTPASLVQNAPATVGDGLNSWKLGLVHKPQKNGSIYLAAAAAAQPPGGAALAFSTSSTNVNNPSMQPQESDHLELGTKWDLADGRLGLSGAWFRSENRNETITDALPGESVQAGHRTVSGFEFGATGQLGRTWTVTTGVSLLQPRIGRGTAATGSSTTGEVDLIPFTPKRSATAWVTYTGLPDWTLAGGGATYSKVRRSNTSAVGGLVEAPGYTVLDAMARYTVNRRIALQANVYNLTDRSYVASLNNSGMRYTPGAPRSAQISALLTY